MPLNLVIKETNTLNLEVLVKQRKIHEPKSTAKAIRQVNRLALPVSVTGKVIANDVEPTPVRDALMKWLTELLPDKTKQNTTTGVDRQIRHVGSYISRDVTSGTTPAQDVNASVSYELSTTSSL